MDDTKIENMTLDEALNMLYMQGEDAGRSDYGSAVHQITCVKAVKSDLFKILSEMTKEYELTDIEGMYYRGETPLEAIPYKAIYKLFNKEIDNE